MTAPSAPSAYWLVQETGNPRFPWRVAVYRDGLRVVALRAQEKWPATGANVFCIRDGSEEEEVEWFPVAERVPVVAIDRYGKRLSVTLDRPTRKRCEFLFLTKPYRDRPGTYEQIFFRTQTAVHSHRNRGRVQLHARPELHVVIDSHERYPWKFAGARVSRRALPAGDYAVESGDRILALVERKTFDNLLADFGQVAVLHQALTDLSSVPAAAVVVEAQYADFADPRRLTGRWPAAHAVRVLAELSAVHPSVPIVYAGTRAQANQWCLAFFRAVASRAVQDDRDAAQLVAETPAVHRTAARADLAIREALLSRPGAFRLADVAADPASFPLERVRRVANALRTEGRLTCSGRGRAATWEVVASAR